MKKMAYPSGSIKVAEDLNSGDSSKIEETPLNVYNRTTFCSNLKGMAQDEFDHSSQTHCRKILFEESPSVTDLMMIREESNCHQEGIKVVYIHSDDFDDYDVEEIDSESGEFEENKLDHRQSADITKS
ncbi:uncharacterized protein LOC106662080 [Cimex lectularius]|uniref:Uncharacterized protein n=1 Tax=Cimex lectularius TaxID=79782 RepID=A0A8I6R8U0_CIMLE|nr:uncharacterized protein LOC106662080 [Cimex lectularius]XP_014241374.1 uncharacterized protein LOC106662080 [Cimex lectularius]